MSSPAETWKRIPGTLYEASSEGRVRRAVGGRGARKGHVLSPWTSGGRDGNGYLYVVLCEDGARRSELVHRLVALAFHGPPAHGCDVVDHLDGDGENNCPENLEWVSRRENFERSLAVNGGGYEPTWMGGQRYPWEES